MATLFNDMGDYPKAAELLEEVIAHAEKNKSRREMVESMIELGKAVRNMGDAERAKQLHENALDNSFELKSCFLEIEIRNNLALDHIHLNNVEEALEEAKEANAKALAMEDPYLQYTSYAVLGKVYSKMRNFEKAFQVYQKSVDIIKIIREHIVDEQAVQTYIRRKDIQEIYKETSKLLKKIGSPE